jgi:hypothetical protein
MVLASVAALAGTTAVAHTGERSLLDAGKFWTPGGSVQTNTIIGDPKHAPSPSVRSR